jgi:transposase-like protein
MPKLKTAKKECRIDGRITRPERDIFEAISKIEALSESETIRYIIRLAARAYGLLPTVDCPDCGSQQTSKTADDLRVCEKCGQEFGE